MFRHTQVFKIRTVHFSQDVIIDDFIAPAECDDLVGVLGVHL